MGFLHSTSSERSRIFFDVKFCDSDGTNDDEAVEKKYFVIPFLGDISYNMRKDLDSLFLNYFTNFKL